MNPKHKVIPAPWQTEQNARHLEQAIRRKERLRNEINKRGLPEKQALFWLQAFYKQRFKDAKREK